ncbi:MAG: hypothetical protein IJO57_01085 [Bacilli bacterium]|nr:hypothetical protein [Bacilli bacterium]
MKRKILLGLLAVVMCFTLVGCGDKESTGGGGKAPKFSGKYEYNPPTDNFYIETEGDIRAKVGNLYTYYEKSDDEYALNYHINDEKEKVYTFYEGQWYIDSNLSYSEYKDSYKDLYPLSAMDEYFMKYFRAYGFDDEKLEEYYVGNEKVAGVNCWIFDSKGLNAIYMKFWVDPSNGATLKYQDYDDGEDDVYEVIKYDLNYKKMDDKLVPSSYEGLETW